MNHPARTSAGALGFAVALVAAGASHAQQPPDRNGSTRDLQHGCRANPVQELRRLSQARQIAPMSLRTYAEARPWVRAIRRAVSERTMPPWGADPQFSEFVNDARLGGKDVATLDNWQPSYIFKQAIAAPKGSRIETVAHYDNSAANKPNPDPAARVTFGPEILNGSIDYTVDSQDLRRLTTAAEAGR
jgi:hypothetical protein